MMNNNINTLAMKMILTCLLVMVYMATYGQYTMSGKIEYEKKVNSHARMKDYGDDNNSWYERMKSEVPKFSITYFDLSFDRKRSIYKPGREVPVTAKSFGSDPAADNVVFSDLVGRKVTAVKQVFDEKFVIEDSMRKIEWKLKDEVRTIANIKCRKAVGVICDSVYVVAFYTTDILADSGPEMFGGLPGMILEIAIPRLHTTWVATKVEMIATKDEDYVMKTKGKKVTNKEMHDAVMGGLKDWGKWGTRYVWLSVL
jgi:GLPGLI family protein